MGKKMSGLQWYQKVYKFLSSHEAYLIKTSNEEQKAILIDVINTINDGSIRLKCEIRKYGLDIFRGRRGDSAIVSKNVAIEYCKRNNLNFDIQVKREKIIRYTAQLFKYTKRLKNIVVHRGKRGISKNTPYKEQLKTEQWDKFRKLVLSKRGKACELCGSTKRLQIHHQKYKYGHKAWEYSINDVIVVCKDCHERLHNINQ